MLPKGPAISCHFLSGASVRRGSKPATSAPCLARMSRHKGHKPSRFSTVPMSMPKRLVSAGILAVASTLAVCVDDPEPDSGVGEVEEEADDPVTEDGGDGIRADSLALISTGDDSSACLSAG